MLTFLEYCVNRRCCYVDLRCGMQRGGGGEVNVHGIVTKRCCYVDLRCGIQRGWGDVNVHGIVSPKDVVTLIFVVAYRGGGGNVNVHGIASPEDVETLKMLLRWRCCYVDGFDTLKILLRWTCCYVEDVLMLKMLLRWLFWYVEDVVTLNMLLRWRCCCVENVENAVKTALWMWRVKSLMCISPMVLWWTIAFLCFPKTHQILINTQFHWFLRRQHKMKNLKNIKKKKKNFKRRTTYPRYVVCMLNWFHMLSNYGKNTKHCKTQWKMTFSKIANNELELRSGEPQASSQYIYIHTHMIDSKHDVYSAPPLRCKVVLQRQGESLRTAWDTLLKGDQNLVCKPQNWGILCG